MGTPGTASITLTPDNSTSKYTVTSSDTEIATVSETSGTVTVTGVKAGDVTITVTTDNGKTDSETLTVSAAAQNDTRKSKTEDK
ncbi:Ig-like domain-containing protein [bacterium]|nr:Ig-like domain-containing protein [bacterium]